MSLLHRMFKIRVPDGGCVCLPGLVGEEGPQTILVETSGIVVGLAPGCWWVRAGLGRWDLVSERAGDVDPPHEGDVVEALRVVDEAGQCVGAGWIATDPGVEPDRHHSA